MFSLKYMESPYGSPPELQNIIFPDFSLIAICQSSDRICRLHLFLFRQDGDKNTALVLCLPFPLRKCLSNVSVIYGLFSRHIHQRTYFMCIHMSPFCTVYLCSVGELAWATNEHVGYNLCVTLMWGPCSEK